MTADPAIAAAQRAWAAAEQPFIPTMSLEQAAIAAAREALTPLRKLHENWSAAWETPPRWDEDGNAHHTVTLLLQELAKLIYPKVN